MPAKLPLHLHTLPNGLRVVVQPDHTAPVVAVNLWVQVGSGHETPGHTGLAHLFEHLMFSGSPNVADGEHFSRLMAVGGSANATTSLDRTNYFETLPSGALDLALWLEADRHLLGRETLDQRSLDTQRSVVGEEKRQRYDNQPYGDAFARILGMLFPPGHPYHHPTIGSMEDLAAATLADAHAFHARHYRPENTVLVVAGDAEPGRVLERVDHWFSEWEAGPSPVPAPWAPLGPRSAAEGGQSAAHQKVYSDVPAARVHLAMRAPHEGHPDHIPLQIAMDIAAGLTSSRLQSSLVRRDELVHGVMGQIMGTAAGTAPGLMVADVLESVDPTRVADAMIGELLAIGADGVSEEEVATAIADTERDWLASLAHVDHRADLLGHFATLAGDPHAAWGWLDAVRATDAEQVQQAASRWFTPDAFVTLTYQPQQERR